VRRVDAAGGPLASRARSRESFPGAEVGADPPAPVAARAPGARGRAWRRAAGSALLVLHLSAVVASLLHGSPPGDLLRRWTRPYEHLAGVYQQWNMFAPNAPRATEWMEVVGLDPAGGRHPLPAVAGPPSGEVQWLYSRRSKFERQLLGRGKGELRRGVAQWACAGAAAQGLPLAAVELWELRARTPPPAARVPFPQWERERSLLEQWPCP
jgi:hypothetical protein